MKIGGNYLGNGKSEFVVWAPLSEEVALRILSPSGRIVPMEKDAAGYWSVTVEDVSPGVHYLYRLDKGRERPDPASRFQPQGVHGPSQLIDTDAFAWRDEGWQMIDLRDMIIYELHTGTFTEEGTFEAIIPQLEYLRDLGVNAIEVMPVAQFPGARNWGYDGVYPFAPQNSYGGPAGLMALINACHRKGLAVILDVVYNHLGPEGNYLADFGPYFTDRYKTPWGDAVNFDGPYSDEVRRFFILNALYWVTEYHVDALRLDAIHGIYDFSARHFLQELAMVVRKNAEAMGRAIHVIAESDLNDVRVINPPEAGGHGLDAQWNEDFHHALHALLTGERTGYYEDFGEIGHLEKAMREGFVYSGEYSGYRKRRHGNPSKERPAHQFVVFSQNHDQVGNRAVGDRLGQTQPREKLKLAAGIVLLSPSIPLLFMGEEYGETAPFQYFVSHLDDSLVDAVRRGRKEEFASFLWQGEVPDPQAEQTFLNSKIRVERHTGGQHRILFEYYKRLIGLRKGVRALSYLSEAHPEVQGFDEERILVVRRCSEGELIICLYNFNREDRTVSVSFPEGTWERALDSSSEEWGGPGALTEETIESRGSECLVRLRSHAVVLYQAMKGA